MSPNPNNPSLATVLDPIPAKVTAALPKFAAVPTEAQTVTLQKAATDLVTGAYNQNYGSEKPDAAFTASQKAIIDGAVAATKLDAATVASVLESIIPSNLK